MRFDDQFIEKVVEANNIVEVLGQYTELKGRGDQYMGLCPFPDHNEKTPSFSVSESKQLYNCFGCKKGGNIITFLKDYSGFSFVEAIEYLANKAHIELPKENEKSDEIKSKGRRDLKNNMFRANKFAAVFYHQKLKALPSHHKLIEYLKKRNLTDEIIEEFRIGYAPEAWDELVTFLQNKKVPTDISENLGLIRKNKNGGYFDLFRDRLMFPIFAIDSEVVGFGGRIIDQGQPKYINSHESEVFKKGQSFFGLDKSTKYIRSEDRVFVVEGYMDLLALYSRGVRNVVATLGTALTESHVKLLKRWTKNIVLLFDGDQAGQVAGERSLIHFFKHDLLPQVFRFPDGQDPDDFITEKGKEGFLEAMEKSQDLFLSQMNVWMEGYRGQPKDKIEFVDKVAFFVKALQDKRLIQLYVEELGRRLNEDPNKVYRWIFTGEKAAVSAPRDLKESPAKASEAFLNLDGATEDELVLLGLSLKSLKYMNFFIENEGVETLNHNDLKDLFSQVVAKYGQEPGNFDMLAHLVVSRVKDPEKIVNLINISSDDEVVARDEELLVECFKRVKDRYLQRKARRLVAEMKNEHSEDKLERFVNIQEQRKALKELNKSALGE